MVLPYRLCGWAGYRRDVLPLFVALEDILRNRRCLFIHTPVLFDAPHTILWLYSIWYVNQAHRCGITFWLCGASRKSFRKRPVVPCVRTNQLLEHYLLPMFPTAQGATIQLQRMTALYTLEADLRGNPLGGQ